jgi:hypothetical protein
MEDIETPRLLLRIIPPSALAAGLSGDRTAIAQSLGASVPPDLIEEPDVLRHAARLSSPQSSASGGSASMSIRSMGSNMSIFWT